MIIRRSSQGYRIRLHRNTTPGLTRTKKYKDGTVETLTYPTSGYDYFVEVDGEIVRRSDSFKNIEEYYNIFKDEEEKYVKSLRNYFIMKKDARMTERSERLLTKFSSFFS